jgi:hypothetical protein
MTDVHRTTFLVEVFSDGPFVTTTNDYDPFDLQAINYAITEGDCIGNVQVHDVERVPEDLLREHLLRIGNDGTFFDREEEL